MSRRNRGSGGCGLSWNYIKYIVDFLTIISIQKDCFVVGSGVANFSEFSCILFPFSFRFPDEKERGESLPLNIEVESRE